MVQNRSHATYSQTVKTDAMVLVSGQLALAPTTDNLVDKDIKKSDKPCKRGGGAALIV